MWEAANVNDSAQYGFCTAFIFLTHFNIFLKIEDNKFQDLFRLIS